MDVFASLIGVNCASKSPSPISFRVQPRVHAQRNGQHRRRVWAVGAPNTTGRPSGPRIRAQTSRTVGLPATGGSQSGKAPSTISFTPSASRLLEMHQDAVHLVRFHPAILQIKMAPRVSAPNARAERRFHYVRARPAASLCLTVDSASQRQRKSSSLHHSLIDDRSDSRRIPPESAAPRQSLAASVRKASPNGSRCHKKICSDVRSLKPITTFGSRPLTQGSRRQIIRQ